MELVLALVVGGLFSCAVYLLLQRSIVKLALGLSILSNAANLLILTAGGLNRRDPPLIGPHADAASVSDPLPQAMILTAIVISFGVLAFALALIHRAYTTVGSDDVDVMKASDQ